LALIIIISFLLIQFNSVTLTSYVSGSSSTDDWPMFHHDLQRSGYSTSTAPNTNQTLWSYTVGWDTSSSIVVADGKVYVSAGIGHGMSGSVYCLNAATGAHIWECTTSIIYSDPAVADGKVYGSFTKLGTWNRNVYCLNAADGAYIWNYTTDSGATATGCLLLLRLPMVKST
jgi:outer membrane protein assembly factor BamB